MQSIVLSDLKAMAVDPELAWESFRPGVDIHRLYPAVPDGAAAALLRYQPGASVPYHLHTGFEHILVLSGSQTDANGTYPAGTLVINPPDTRHTVSSPEGCIVLAIWAKPVQIEE
ncbi:cupin domain-containing protein [Nodosilinea sp. LEGE 07298]|jgi:anti-sigma factor ChrR (cupin superfamily)|uniref:cupin domain-containing protein n=1 Tax=Nodosilinea sp. LEGE 07298 TaxID=2777970 RepID=UPI00187F6D18|nr:cupin domain-containing protein [Nodosilinea sp. LEGE 07298]MBE9113913.1 cupin domain-containing protein [Nodosilinea sp. LEGE 07298]